MSRLITVEKAKEEVKRLQDYIMLVENYQADTLDKQIIKEYAITNSIAKVADSLKIDKEYVAEVIRRKGKDDLHKIVRTGYMVKTKPSRTKF